MKNNRVVKSFLYSLFTFFSVYSYLNIYIKNNYLLYLLDIILYILLFIFYYKLDKDIKLSKKYHIFIIIMSFIFVLLYSYEIKSTSELFFSNLPNFLISLVKVYGHYLFYKVVIYYFIKFMSKEYKINNKLILKFKSHPFLYSFIFLSICYLFILIFYYPGILNYDNANQIKEVMGIHTRYIDAVIPVSELMLTNFNPIIHTLILGNLFKIGYLINNVNFGLFLYIIFQLLIVISIYSYVLSYMIKKNINPLYPFISLLLLGFIPLFGFYAITAVKDTLYTAFVLLFSVKIYDIYKYNNCNFKSYLELYIISLLVCLFRNNGIIIILFTIPFLLYKDKKIITIPILIFIFFTVFNRVLLPSFGVSGTSIREVLSIPFQQTARLVKYHDNDIVKEDKIVIGKLLDYDNLANDYKEYLADPVKNKFNKYYQKEDLINYYKVWNKYLFKYPNIYLDAWLNNISSYFNPFENGGKIYYKLNPKLREAGFDYHYNNLSLGRDILYNLEILVEISPLGLLLNIGIITWLSILIFIMLLKNKNYIFLIPNIISISFCIISPANTYYRYIYPSLVLLVCTFAIIKVIMENKIANTNRKSFSQKV